MYLVCTSLTVPTGGRGIISLDSQHLLRSYNERDLKRLARKGYIKITTIPCHRIRYLLTPEGFTEKSRLIYLYRQYSLPYYRDMRLRLKAMMSTFDGAHGQRVVIYGTTELVELAYLSLW